MLTLKIKLLIVVTILISVAIIFYVLLTTKSSLTPTATVPSSVKDLSSACNVSNLSIGDYDEQIVLVSEQDVLGLVYNVTVIPQNNSATKYGYLLNGRTNEGYWYQFGLGIYPTATKNNTIRLVAQIWKNATPLTPPLNFSFSKPITYGDTVSLFLIPTYNTTVMAAIERNTNSSIALCANSTAIRYCNINNLFFSNPSFFIGGFSNIFTGLMVEFMGINKTVNMNITHAISFNPIKLPIISVINSSSTETQHQNINLNDSELSIHLYRIKPPITPIKICYSDVIYQESITKMMQNTLLNTTEIVYGNGTFVVR